MFDGIGQLFKQNIWMVLWLFSAASVPQLAYSEDASRLKVAFVFNFTKFVKWPVAVEEAGGDLTICLFGHDQANAGFTQIDGRSIRKFTLKVKKVHSIDTLNDCRMIFISDLNGTQKVIDHIENKAILTVGEGREFVDQKGMIGLYIEESRIRFDINYEQAKASQLNVSSKLLQLAGRVL